MNKKEIEKTFKAVQQTLNTLQGEEASFLFIGNEGNHFTIGGSAGAIAAQILFSMIRYPVVKEIIKTCAARFDEVEKEYGNSVRNVSLEDLIEINSGN